MTHKYKYHPFVEAHQQILVVAIGRKTGSSTRVAAIYASAEASGVVVDVREIKLPVHNFSEALELVDFSWGDLVVVVADPYVDPSAYVQAISAKSSGIVLAMDRLTSPAYSDEYEHLLSRFDAIGLQIAVGLPRVASEKAALLQTVNGVTDTALKPPPPNDYE